MALTSTEKSMCNSLVQKFDPLVSPIRNAKQAYRDTVADFSSQLRATSWSPQQDVTAGVVDLQIQTNDVLPGDGLSDMARIKHFMDNCAFLGGTQPVSVVLGSTLGVFDSIDGFMDNIGIGVPEIGLGKLADQINRILSGLTVPGGSNISELFQQGDILINCVDQLCSGYNPEIIYMSDTLDGLYDDFDVTKNPVSPNYGKFDYDALYSSVGLSSQQITNMDISVAGITQVKNGATTAIDNSVNSVKQLIGAGGFF